MVCNGIVAKNLDDLKAKIANKDKKPSAKPVEAEKATTTKGKTK